MSSRSAAYWPGHLGVSQTSLRVGRSGEGPGDKNVPLACLAPASRVTPGSEAPVPPDDPGGPEGRSAAEPCLRGWREVAARPPPAFGRLGFLNGAALPPSLSDEPAGGLANMWLVDVTWKPALACFVWVPWVCFSCSYGPGIFSVVFPFTSRQEAWRPSLPGSSSGRRGGSEPGAQGPARHLAPAARGCWPSPRRHSSARSVPVSKEWGLTLFPSCG